MQKINIINLDCVGSTNTYAKENISSFSLPCLIIANSQTSGRGRQGKSFFSPADTGLYMTAVFPAPKSCNLLTPAAAVAVCKTLEKNNIKSQIKWVNDIFVDGHKVCGILTECFNKNDNLYIALGIGINLTTTDFPDDLDIAGSINLECNKTLLAKEISEYILEYMKNPDNKMILNEYKKRLFIIGKNISYKKNNIEYQANVEGINEQCNLIIKRSDGHKDILSSGEISIKI